MPATVPCEEGGGLRGRERSCLVEALHLLAQIEKRSRREYAAPSAGALVYVGLGAWWKSDEARTYLDMARRALSILQRNPIASERA